MYDGNSSMLLYTTTMKTRMLRIIMIFTIVLGVFYLNGGLDRLVNPQTVKAFGDLLVDFHVPAGKPIFTVTNMKPGDSQTRPIDVSNSGTVARYISTKGFRNTGIGNIPKIESALKVEINDGSSTVYGPKSMEEFFIASADLNGIPLGIVTVGGHKTYNFTVNFPTSADNNFQAKSVTVDLTFGVISGDNVVINEVFYTVDSKHGLDSPKDRNDRKSGQNNEWLELYNPTERDISLKNWSLVDNSGIQSKINANKILKAGGFLLVSKDASTWKYWDIKPAKDTLELGNQLGDGLDNTGDQLILKNATGVEVDRMGWGTGMATGHSTERLTPGFDTNKTSDWIDRFPPTPAS